MKLIQILTVICFAAVLAVPLCTFNREENAVSLIDNRNLEENPFSGGDMSADERIEKIENYVNDRIGLRDDMILSYTLMNDRLFHKMVHPTYTYGKDGYIFGAGLTVDHPYTEYHEAFADMVKKIQDYCEARGVPFLFVFEPGKPAVLTKYIPEGTNYDRAWVGRFLEALDKRGVHYIDNTDLMREKTEAGEAVFNQKYDANHWNDLGAYYGCSAILAEMKKDMPAVHVNTWDELSVSETLQTSLMVSEFPIHEMVPSFSIGSPENIADFPKYDKELYRDPSYHTFGYCRNEARIQEAADKATDRHTDKATHVTKDVSSNRALFFQGSYLNRNGYKFLANGLEEYIYVHDYQNVMDFSYYYNIFQPDYVVFEAAEYTLTNTYFDYERVCDLELNPLPGDVKEEDVVKISAHDEDVSVDRGDMLTKIQWKCGKPSGPAWLRMDRDYDMKKTEDGYEVTVLTETYDENQNGENFLKIIRENQRS